MLTRHMLQILSHGLKTCVFVHGLAHSLSNGCEFYFLGLPQTCARQHPVCCWLITLVNAMPEQSKANLSFIAHSFNVLKSAIPKVQILLFEKSFMKYRWNKSIHKQILTSASVETNPAQKTRHLQTVLREQLCHSWAEALANDHISSQRACIN